MNLLYLVHSELFYGAVVGSFDRSAVAFEARERVAAGIEHALGDFVVGRIGQIRGGADDEVDGGVFDALDAVETPAAPAS